jgi:hypothetical protein
VGGNKGNGSILWYDGAFGCQRSDFKSSPCEIFKAQVKLRFTSAFKKWKFLSGIFLSF